MYKSKNNYMTSQHTSLALFTHLIATFSKDSVDQEFDYCFENFRDNILHPGMEVTGTFLNELEEAWDKISPEYKPEPLEKLSSHRLTVVFRDDFMHYFIVPAKDFELEWKDYLGNTGIRDFYYEAIKSENGLLIHITVNNDLL